MALLLTMLTAVVGILFFASGLVKLSECRSGLAAEPPPRGGDHARAALRGVVRSVQAIAALGLTVPVLLQQGMILVPISGLVLVLILAFGVLPASPSHVHPRVFLVMCAPAAFMAYTPGPDVLRITSETRERG